MSDYCVNYSNYIPAITNNGPSGAHRFSSFSLNLDAQAELTTCVVYYCLLISNKPFYFKHFGFKYVCNIFI